MYTKRLRRVNIRSQCAKMTVPDCTRERSLSMWQWYDPKFQGEDQSWKPGLIVTKYVSGGIGKHSSNVTSCRAGMLKSFLFVSVFQITVLRSAFAEFDLYYHVNRDNRCKIK
ncbi:hypothetical protein T05_10891 [Trichinella murrelli]|uniref:Uncharacterized protein n=1 Tax=Trichinella murrelli TaxID=144512 RepID=A0A0V0T3Y7_9BILA|nr:hypothetical protein T05_7108 [Trichinella murrelli]KRX33971.1 hypothetical protein T05_10891 [Trichinella murrelli]